MKTKALRLLVLCSLLVVFLCLFIVLHPRGFVVSGNSMYPKLRSGEYHLFVNARHIDDGDIIIFKLRDELLVKRVDSYSAKYGYWVTADNKNNGLDSKNFGYIPKKDVVGVLVW